MKFSSAREKIAQGRAKNKKSHGGVKVYED
jgi:hypothetical protein